MIPETLCRQSAKQGSCDARQAHQLDLEFSTLFFRLAYAIPGVLETEYLHCALVSISTVDVLAQVPFRRRREDRMSFYDNP